MEHWCNDTDRRKLKYLEKICPIAILSTTNHTPTDLGFKSALCGERLVNICLRHGIAQEMREYLKLEALENKLTCNTIRWNGMNMMGSKWRS
jgi:hypothetical protein